MQRIERRLNVPGGTVESWMIDAANGDAGTPMLFLHGGPGSSCAGFSTLAPLADSRPLVMWDQIGSRAATWTGTADELWTLDRFCSEVDAVRAAYDLDEVILFGHSWGGWLSVEYLSRSPSGVVGAVLADTSASFRSFQASIDRRIAELPIELQAAVHRELAGEVTFDDPAYHRAAVEYYERFVIRNVPGDNVAESVIARQRSAEAYQVMQGADELHADGVLAAWDRRSDLASIEVPTLVIGGAFDHIDLQCAREIAHGLPHSELAEFADSSHCPHLEQPNDVVDAVRGFLGG